MTKTQGKWGGSAQMPTLKEHPSHILGSLVYPHFPYAVKIAPVGVFLGHIGEFSKQSC